jgi:hypothetical protein
MIQNKGRWDYSAIIGKQVSTIIQVGSIQDFNTQGKKKEVFLRGEIVSNPHSMFLPWQISAGPIISSWRWISEITLAASSHPTFNSLRVHEWLAESGISAPKVGGSFGQLQTSLAGHTYGRVEKDRHFGSAKAILQ